MSEEELSSDEQEKVKMTTMDSDHVINAKNNNMMMITTIVMMIISFLFIFFFFFSSSSSSSSSYSAPESSGGIATAKSGIRVEELLLLDYLQEDDVAEQNGFNRTANSSMKFEETAIGNDFVVSHGLSEKVTHVPLHDSGKRTGFISPG